MHAAPQDPAARLIARMRAQRQSWVELEPASDAQPAKRVQILRPAESQVRDMIEPLPDQPGQFGIKVGLQHVKEFACDWDGITEADLIGAAGASDAVPFSAALWSEVVTDRAAWIAKTAQAILDAILNHQRAAAADAKN